VALTLILVSATVRLAGQVLAINTVGALCLVLDVYALGLLLRLARRARPISPAWLAVVFAFSLPLERIVQRTIGGPQAPQDHLDAGRRLARAEGLGEVVVAADLQADDAVDLLVARLSWVTSSMLTGSSGR
jgi:hypothetical protein